MLIGLDNAEQVIAFNAGRMVLESFQYRRLRFRDTALLRQHCSVSKVIRMFGWGLLRHVRRGHSAIASEEESD